MPKKKASDRIMKLREFDIRYAISGYTKAQIIDYLSDLEIPEDATLYLSATEYYGDYEIKAAFEYYTEETDEEYQARTRQGALQEVIERQHYERLKAKFEGKNK